MKLQSLRGLNLALEEFRGVYPDAPLLSFQVFLTIALSQGVQAKDMIWRTGVPQSTISRHLTVLKSRPGLELIELEDDPTDGRAKVAFLTQKGRLLACSLIRIIEPTSSITAQDFLKSREQAKEG